jgi:tripartite ATP-independent transporter DctM subunit
MGAMLEQSRVAKRLFEATNLLLRRLPGGVCHATIVMCAVFAAGTGIVGAVEVLVGLVAIPQMMKLGYARPLIAGTICAGGSLGTMIPPSIVVVIYAALAQTSIAYLFAAVLIPGGLMVLMFLGYLFVHALIWPSDMPKVQLSPADQNSEHLVAVMVRALVPPLLLIVSVIGSILAGMASPTEAAGIGCLGVILLTVLYGDFSWSALKKALITTVQINAMISLIIAGGTLYAGAFLVHGGNTLVTGFVSGLNLGTNGVIGLLLGILFLLGCVLDWVSVVLIAIPIFLPILKTMGIDTVWFGTMAILVIQTSYLTPPMAPAIFYLRSIAPPEMTFGDMYRGVLPFVGIQLLLLVLVWMFPSLSTMLPEIFFR